MSGYEEAAALAPAERGPGQPARTKRSAGFARTGAPLVPLRLHSHPAACSRAAFRLSGDAARHVTLIVTLGLGRPVANRANDRLLQTGTNRQFPHNWLQILVWHNRRHHQDHASAFSARDLIQFLFIQLAGFVRVCFAKIPFILHDRLRSLDSYLSPL